MQDQHFVDSIRLKVQAGKGGNGLPRYSGVGGKGGDVLMIGNDKTTLREIREIKQDRKRRKDLTTAGNGEHSKLSQYLGKPGKKCEIKVPLGVTVINEKGAVLGDINKEGDKVLVAIGGEGGNIRSNFSGCYGQTQIITLDLKLIADCGFVGFPNAGKSTLLKAISRANPAISPMPFTTLHPNIGIVEFKDGRKIRAADLPGLIEGAHINLGLGHSFLKHIVRTKLLMFIIDVNGFQYRPDWPARSALDSLLLLNKELELYDDMLLMKPAMIVVTKLDDKKFDYKYKRFLEDLQNLLENGLEGLKEEVRPNQLIHFDEIIPVCAKNAYNILELRNKMRYVLDINTVYSQQMSGVPQSFREMLAREQKRERVEQSEVMLV